MSFNIFLSLLLLFSDLCSIMTKQRNENLFNETNHNFGMPRDQNLFNDIFHTAGKSTYFMNLFLDDSIQ